MKPLQTSLALCALATCGAAALADEMGQVISSTPMAQQVAVPRQVCHTETVAMQAPNTGAGALLGAIAGGAVGHAVGQGSGRAVATLLGAMGGAVMGDQVEGAPTQWHNVQRCTIQTFYEDRPARWNVVYEYAGKQYTVQMPHDPGPTVRLRVTPVSETTGQPLDLAAQANLPAPVDAQPPARYRAAPVYAPLPYGYPVQPYYYPPVGISLNLGFGRGYSRGHWR